MMAAPVFSLSLSFPLELVQSFQEIGQLLFAPLRVSIKVYLDAAKILKEKIKRLDFEDNAKDCL